MPSVHRFFIKRYYLRTICIICNEEIIHNQYKPKTFNRIAHVECAQGKTNHGRMNDTVMIKTAMVNKKQGWKRI